MLDFLTMAGILLLIASPFIYFHKMKKNIKEFKKWYADEIKKLGIVGVTPEFGENSTLRNLVEYF